MSEQREDGRKHSQPENVQRATEMMNGQRQDEGQRALTNWGS
jgi:hypothetical protein